MDAQDRLAYLQYLAPGIVAVYYLLTICSSIARVGTDKVQPQTRLRITVLGASCVVFITYIVEATLIISLIFGQPSAFGTKPANIHAICFALLWTAITNLLYSSATQPWYPYYGSWILTVILEISLFAVTTALKRPASGVEFPLVALQAARILLLVALLAIFFSWRAFRSREGTDEETAPLLSGHGADGYAATAGHATTTGHADKKADSSKSDADASKDGDDDDNDEDEYYQKKDKGEADIVSRLAEEGTWFAYIKSFMIFVPLIVPHRSRTLQLRLAGVGFCLLAGRVLNILIPRQLGIVVNELGAGEMAGSFSALAFYILFGSISANLGMLRQWLWLPIEMNASSAVQRASYNHIMDLSCDFHDSKQSGDMFQAIAQGDSIVDLLDSIFFTLLPSLADLVIACVYFQILFDSYMALVALTSMLVYFRVSAHMTAKTQNLRRGHNQFWRKKSQVMYDTVGGWKTVSYFNRIPYSKVLFETALTVAQAAALSDNLSWYWMYGVQSLILDVGRFAACILAVYQITSRVDVTVGSFVTLLTYWGNFSGPLSTVSRTFRSLLRDLIDAEALLRIFRQDPTVGDGPNEFILKRASVRFENVQFKYEGKSETIDDLSFNVKPGQKIALVGQTGAGKSTILKLLFRFYDVAAGRILIDGQDIRDCTLQSVRQNIGVVPQDPTLFNTTVMENLRYARLDATDEEVYEACKAAAFHEKVLTFKKGYKTKVGERGVKLSGGELQRLAIARAILKDPAIMLLDEATSSVDSETEALIQEGLKRLCHNRTTFTIAHRLSTVMDADIILVIKDGKILEQGSPAELMQSKGKYYTMWTKQMGIVDAMAKARRIEERAKEDKEEEDLVDVNSVDKDSKPSLSDQVSGDNTPKLDTGTSTSVSLPSDNVPTGTEVPASPSKIAFRADAPEFVPTSLPDSNPVTRRRNWASEVNEEAESQLAAADVATKAEPAAEDRAKTGPKPAEEAAGSTSKRTSSRARRAQSSSDQSSNRAADRSSSRPPSASRPQPASLLALQQASIGGGGQGTAAGGGGGGGDAVQRG